jgi:hypothetical protein
VYVEDQAARRVDGRGVEERLGIGEVTDTQVYGRQQIAKPLATAEFS